MAHREHDPNKPRRAHPRIYALILALVLILTLGVAGFGVVSAVQQANAQKQTIKVLQARIDRGSDLYDKLFDSYQQLSHDCTIAADCDTAAPAPSTIASEAAATPVAGQNGRDGRDGADGLDATPEGIFAQVARYCSLIICVGAPGTNGTNGTNGSDGQTVVGPAGPPGADSTVPGPEGPAGPTGPAGADGRGITSGPTCNADGTWTTTYSDGTTETQDGPCRVSLFN